LLFCEAFNNGLPTFWQAFLSFTDIAC